MSRLRVAILADYLEEGWPSMDLVAEMLMDRLTREHASTIEVSLIRPALRRRLSRVSTRRLAFGVDRMAARLWDYPRFAGALSAEFDLFHVVDHSYAQLVHELPANRTIVTCHDLDTFRSVLEPERERRSAAFRAMTRRILSGLRKAGHVVCDTEATRAQLIEKAGVSEERTSVVHNGLHPSFSPLHEAAADREAARLLGSRRTHTDVLHVGSAIARKRIDILIRIIGELGHGTRLVRVGGPFTAEQTALARDLGVSDKVGFVGAMRDDELPEAYATSTIYLGASRVDRDINVEGFGISFLEAGASGIPSVAGDSGGVRSAVRDGETGLVVPPTDVDAIADAIRSLLLNADRRKLMGVAARRAVETHYNWDRVARDTRDFTNRGVGSG